MKQGSGSNSNGGRKREPIGRAVSVDAVADIGIQHIDTRPEPLYEGRGYRSPAPVATTTHHCGSQGKHK